MNTEQGKGTTKKARSEGLRLGLIAPRGYVRKYGRFLNYLLVGLADESIPVALVCDYCDEVKTIIQASVEVIRYPEIRLSFMEYWNVKALVERLGGVGVNVLHCLSERKSELAKKLSCKLGVHYVLSVNSLQGGFGSVALSGRRLARVVCSTDSIATDFGAAHPRFTERIARVDMGVFAEEQIRCFQNGSGVVNIVTSADGVEANEFEHFLKALKHLVVDGYDFMLVIVSGGKGDRGVRKLVSELGLLDRVVIIERLAGRGSVLSACDIFVRLVNEAAFSSLVLEAMSFGLAVAGCKGGVDDLLIEDETAAIFEESNEVSIYDCLRKLFDSREYARELAAGGQHYVRSKHSVSVMVGQMLEIYRQALKAEQVEY